MITHAVHPDWAGASAGFWLRSLKDAHSALIGAIDKLARLTFGELPSRQVLIEVRWAVSQASLARRLLWGQIHTGLARRVDPRFESDLRRLQEADIDLIKASAKHVGRWTVDAVAKDWDGYRRASERMRRQMLDAIAGEKRLLYPILQSLEREHSADEGEK